VIEVTNAGDISAVVDELLVQILRRDKIVRRTNTLTDTLQAAGPHSGYRYMPGVRQYSAGVVADPGYGIVRVRFPAPMPLTEAFDAAATIITDAGRPLGALCAWELRSPEPFTERSFADFNEKYIDLLDRWGVVRGANPIARTNVCPTIAQVPEPSAEAFSFTNRVDTTMVEYVVSGSAEAPEGRGDYKDHAVAYRDVSADGLLAKIRFVVAEMRRRMTAMGVIDHPPRVVQVYTVHEVQRFLAEEVLEHLGNPGGVVWHPHRPPVVDLEYEMDCRRVGTERLLNPGLADD
jgi:hypothetical protein